MQCPSVISYHADVPCPGPVSCHNLFSHVCDLCLFSYPIFVCRSRHVMLTILLSICICLCGCKLFLCLGVSDLVSSPYTVVGSMHEL